MLTLVLANASFVPPTISDGHLPEIFPWGAEYGTGFGKQMLLVLLSVVLITAFFAWAMRRPRLVPGKAQHSLDLHGDQRLVLDDEDEGFQRRIHGMPCSNASPAFPARG